MTETDKCCGTCRWFTPCKKSDVFQILNRWGYCSAPVPVCVHIRDSRGDAGKRDIMSIDEGTDCPCYERKDEDGNEKTTTR